MENNILGGESGDEDGGVKRPSFLPRGVSYFEGAWSEEKVVKVPFERPRQMAVRSEGSWRRGGEQTCLAPEKWSWPSPFSFSDRRKRYWGQVSAWIGRSLVCAFRT